MSASFKRTLLFNSILLIYSFALYYIPSVEKSIYIQSVLVNRELLKPVTHTNIKIIK